MLLFLPIIFLVVYIYQRFSSKIYSQMRGKLSELNTKLNENISGMRIIQQFRQEKRIEEEFEATNNEYLALRKKVIRINALLLFSFVNLLLSIATILALSLFGIQSQNRVIAAGMVYAFVTNIQLFFRPIGQTMDFLSVFSDGVVASHRIKGIMAEEETAPAQNPGAKEVIQEGKIEFRNVSFSYDGEHDVLKNISFVLNPGETLAFVGHTGSGKSSIINVFMRFYEFDRGQILIDDKDIRDYPIEELRQKIGLVLQDAFMFVGDINSNIRMMNKNITDEEIVQAAKFTQAHHFIEQLEGDYTSEVIEHGAAYSSGQRQLLNFARTIVLNPKILVLDEATANIDTETETLIQEGLSNMRQGRTTIAIAHRLSTIKDAHQIIVLDKGSIVEQGNHDALIEMNGHYAQLYHLQTQKV
jgi:ATP-binding cassette subfamily B protein